MKFMYEILIIISMFSLCIAWGLIGISRFISKRKATIVLDYAICAAVMGFIAIIISFTTI